MTDPEAAWRRPDLAEQLQAVADAAPGRLSVAVRADDGWAWSHDAERVVPSASTIKVPILVAALQAVERGSLRLHGPVRLPEPEMRVGGAGPLSLLPSLCELPLVEVLRLMIALSDNDAANAVIDHADLLGNDAVDALLAVVPTRHTRLGRRLMDVEAAARGLQNETCAADLVDIMVALREGRLLGAAMTRTAVEVLQTQQLRDGLPAYLPEDVDVASKTGDVVGLRADMALLERSGRWVVVAVLADELEHEGSDRGMSVLPTFAEIGALAAELLPTTGRP